MKTASGAWVERQGHGIPIVFAHGLGGTGSVWEPQVRALGRGLRSLRLDLNGSGRSVIRPPLSFEGWVDDIEQALDSENIEKAHLVGHSLGTPVLQYFASMHPGRVTSLTLVGLSQADVARKRAVLDRAKQVRDSGMESIADLVIRNALSESTVHEQPAVVSYVRELLMRQDPEGYAQACEASTGGEPVEPERFDCPVLLIAGRDDKVSPFAVSEAFASRAKAAKLVLIEQCGHWHTSEKPREVSDALSRFVRC